MSTELTRPNPDLPTFMAGENFGVEDLKSFVIPPRLKLVQSLSRSELRDKFNIGDVIAMPTGTLVAPVDLNDKHKPMDRGKPFNFIPVFFFAEWITWNPREAQDKPMIAARSFDPRSDIAVKARDSNLRKEPTGVRHCEHLNFIVLIDDEECPLNMTPIVMGFSRGEHKTGTNFAQLISMQKAPICARRYVGQSRLRENAQGEWYGIDITNPQEDAWVGEELFAGLKEKHFEFKAAHDGRRVRVEYDEDDQEPTSRF